MDNLGPVGGRRMTGVFDIGDKVKWNGEKEGEIVTIVAPHQSPLEAVGGKWPEGFTVRIPNSVSIRGSRDHESYIIMVNRETLTSRPKLYWPKVRELDTI